MNALTSTKSFRVVERLPSNLEAAVVLERDIRVKPERIADYCLTTHEPIYEDLATLVESMAYFDRLVPRRRSGGWTRKLTIQLPVYEHWKLQSSTAVEALTEAAWFLTGDQWSFEFVARQGAAPTRQGHLDLARAPIRHVIPFSDGLDSFAQARLSVREHGRDAVMLSAPVLATIGFFRGYSAYAFRESSRRAPAGSHLPDAPSRLLHLGGDRRGDHRRRSRGRRRKRPRGNWPGLPAVSR